MDLDFIKGTKQALECSIKAIFNHKGLVTGEVSDEIRIIEPDLETGNY